MMNRVGLLAGTALLSVVLATVAVACGGGGEEGDVSPSPGATAALSTASSGTPGATPSAAEEQLKKMVLQASDVPAGFTLAQESTSTNEEVVTGSDDPEADLAQLTEWGRILGHGATFSAEASAETGVLLIDSTASLYETDSGAAASFADAVNTARTTDWPASWGQAKDVQVEELPPLDIGDEMLWLRISGTATIGQPATEQPFIQDMVLFRVGRGRGSIAVVSVAIDAAQTVERMVRAQAANMAAALQ
jgi:hypothetical protein